MQYQFNSTLWHGQKKQKKKCGYINTPPSNRMERCYQLHPCLKISSTSYILTKLLSNLSEKKKNVERVQLLSSLLCQEHKVLYFMQLLYSEIEWNAVTSKKKTVRRTLRFIPIHCEEQKYKMYTSESQDNKQIILIQKHSPP